MRRLLIAILLGCGFSSGVASPAFSQIALAGDQSPSDPRIQMISPMNGQTMQSGDSVTVMLRIPAEVKPASVSIDSTGTPVIAANPDVGSGYMASLEIPADFAGPLTLTPEVQTIDGAFLHGQPVTVSVKPVGDLLGIGLSQSDFRFAAPGSQSIALRLTGVYPNNVTQDLTSAKTGTAYSSSNPAVATTNGEGEVTLAGYGTAVITARNGNFADMATVTIEDPDHPLPPVDVTKEFGFKLQPPKLDQLSGDYVEMIEITNVIRSPTIGPLFLVLGALPHGFALTNGYASQTLQPKGTFYIQLPLADGISIPATGGVKLALRFRKTTDAPLTFTPMVFRSATAL